MSSTRSDFDSDDSANEKAFSEYEIKEIDMSAYDVTPQTINDSKISLSNNRFSSSQKTRFDLASSSSSVIPLLFNGKYFSIIKKITETEHQKSAGGIIAACQLCSSKKAIKGSLKVTSNFLQHLKTHHRVKYDKYLSERKKSKRPKSCKTKQSTFDEKILKFLMDTYSPLSIVENPSFINLFEGSGVNISSKRDITLFLDNAYYSLMSSIKEKLKKISYVCTTADAWSIDRQSFFRYTCHWIDESFCRQSVALACRRFVGVCNSDRVADLIHLLNVEFGLNEEKIICTITDNGNHIGKTFKKCENERNNESYEDEYSLDFHVEEISLSGLSPRLSKLLKCGSHTLNLFAITDFQNLLKKHKLTYERHMSSMARCAKIWRKSHRPETAEIIQSILSGTLKTPKATCWNSLYDSINQLLEHKTKFIELCMALCVENFSLSETSYLEEYCILMKPISEGIDFLQKEENNYFGYFLPTLITIKVKLNKLQKSNRLSDLLVLAEGMEDALVHRFSSYFKGNADAYDSIVASITCPAIKDKFLNTLRDTAPHLSSEIVQTILLKYAAKFQEVSDPAIDVVTNKTQKVSTFFDFGDSGEEDTKPLQNPLMAVRKELELYLCDENVSMDTLLCYPTIKKMFMVFNTPLPSSALVERLFSITDIINAQRQNLADDYFEKLLLTRANKAL